jgi:hypothetical protein
MGRIVLSEDGAARRPVTRAWPVWAVVGCALVYVIGYVIVNRIIGGK